MSVEINKISFSYEKKPLISNFSTTIKKGEFVGFIGPNGSGKSTALKLLIGLLKPNKGSISFEGSIGYVPQNLIYDKAFPITTISLVLMGSLKKLTWYGTYPAKVKAKALQLLKEMNLDAFAENAVGSLSGGQLQKALLARALMSDPDILLLDEPTASVDTETEISIYKKLQELKGQKTIIMITHDFEIAKEYLDKILIFQKEIVTVTPDKVCNHYSMGLYHK